MTEQKDLKVIIIGGGLGGLCLAQGLKKAGIVCKVFERDASPVSRLQGYRLSMNPQGLKALHSNLPGKLWNRIQKSLTAQIEGISFVSELLEERFFKKTPEPVDDVNRFGSVSRISLREILLSELGNIVEFNKKFKYYKLSPDETVTCYFEDGSSEEGALLVGADGTKSGVRNQLLPDAMRIETGVSAIAGQVIMDDITKQDFLPAPLRESAVVVDKRPQGLFLASHKLNENQNGENYVFWSFLTSRSNFPDSLETLSPEELIHLVDEMTAGWHQRLKSLIRRADPKTLLVLSYKTSSPPERWKAGPVTLLGDAIHSMPPTSGEGANTALQDAETLCQALIEWKESKTMLTDAVSKYETSMFDYAFRAVENAMVNLRRMVVRNKSYNP